jgi:AraC-like DNA-binding protein
MTTPGRGRTSIDTTQVRPELRVRYWEEECRTNLVGIRCSSYSDHGLLAKQTSLDQGNLRLAITSANAHVIERTPDMIRATPRESIFINVVREGETFIYQRGHCVKVHKGDVLVYDARYPFLLGGAENFSQLHVDIPADLFHTQLVRTHLNHPLHIAAATHTHRLYSHTLSSLLLNLIEGPAQPLQNSESLDSQVCDLLGVLIHQGEGHTVTSALSATHLLAAKAYIEERLGDEGLHADQIAHAAGISERHLRRLFAAQDSAVADYVLARRLDRAREQLLDPQRRGTTVAETAYHCGFASPSHFSRAFKQRFGITPTQLQRQSLH